MSCFKAPSVPAYAPSYAPSSLSSASSSSSYDGATAGYESGDEVQPGSDGTAPRLSVLEALAGKAVLITGATGYLGGVVLEQLLRVAGSVVGPVYVLARARAGKDPRERVARVLGSGLFTQLRRSHRASLAKGDLMHPGCGISEAALREMAAQPALVVIHSAARIALDDPIQETLRNNYEGTRRLLGLLESRLPNCAGFVHVSTAFVGMNQPHNSVVPERLQPLMFGDQRVDHARLARELMTCDKEMADTRAALLCKNWDLPNTYLLGKHLSEALVEQYHREGRLAGGACIVRPSLVSAIAGAPYPGYVGNLAGPSGYMTAFALGFFNSDSAAWHAWHLLDSVPGDVAAAVTLGAAAALAAGIRSREALHQLTAAAEEAALAAAAAARRREGAASAARRRRSLRIPSVDSPSSDGAGGRPRAHHPDIRAHHPHQYHHRHPSPQTPSAFTDAASVGTAGPLTAAPAAPPAPPSGVTAKVAPGRGGEMLVFHAATSSINPCMHYEAYQLAWRFFSKHTPKWRLGGYAMAGPDYTPVPWKVAFKKRITGVKVALAAGLLGCFGEKRAARRLRTGFTAWSYANDVKHDKTLFFSVRNVLALERCLPPAERASLPLVWRGSWVDFGNTYMAAVCKLFMGVPVPPSTPELPHAFVFQPFEIIPERDWPALAGAPRVSRGGVPVAPPVPVPTAALAAAPAAAAAPASPQSAAAIPEGDDDYTNGADQKTGARAAAAAAEAAATGGVGVGTKAAPAAPVAVEMAGLAG
ncbi:hypothetical protein GPECTOR_1g564 [Gonium pectorale]|uniref:Fatty acyl-CoA reductase n=1 Tax=Gonium pectorale TaxID=33097 RepID=A0A150H379_GONPE|nr:hypothetical protein GPECTOR_1g564 [Gonium pectorale]|eukprot:KXZ56626.1 hypothetical protein GPECTOR_1g564 [Gonium pectorale]